MGPLTQQHAPSPATSSLTHSPPPALISRPWLSGQSRQMARELPAGEDAAGAALSKATSHLIWPPYPALTSHLSPSLSQRGVVVGGGGGRWPTLLDLLRYQLAAALKCQQSAPCLLEGISLVCESQPQDSCGPGERH